jgi:prolyl oligopeptidase
MWQAAQCPDRGDDETMKKLAIVGLVLLALNASAQEDPYLWLEDVTGQKQLEWVKEQNERAKRVLEAAPDFKHMHGRMLNVFTSDERIPSVVKRGDFLYNFWQDATYPRGLLRRTTLDEYRKKDPKWELVLDITKLAAEENEKWAYKATDCLYPHYKRCLISLSRGGADAVEVREFDMETKQFVKDGFRLTESKQSVAWVDADTLYVSRDFGPDTLTRSGYPRFVKEWKRGTPIAAAKTLYEANEEDVGAAGFVVNEPGRSYHRIRRTMSVRYGEEFIRHDGQWVMLDAPKDADVSTFNGMLVLRLRSDWKPAGTVFKTGSLIAGDLDEFMAGGRDFEVLFEPRHRVSLKAYTVTKNYLLLDILDNVKARLTEMRREAGQWKRRDVDVPRMAYVGLAALDRDTSDEYWITVSSFIEPTTLYLGKAGIDAREKMKGLPAFFDAKGLKVEQYEATSKDGTGVPYFLVMRENLTLDGSNPTILFGYGGFEISQTPSYSATRGVGWLERGGVWVLANLRGGGEFGPEWHQTARRDGRQKTHDDFIAVGEDLVKRRITSPSRLGIYGGSQGGLLVGAAFTQRPDLFKAVVSAVPLFDMKRYHTMLAGASWMSEYGDPDNPSDWDFIGKYSPYQNVFKEKKYPKVFIATTTRDDRVHPGHARKMFAKMKEQGHDVLYFENTEGGHGAGTTPDQQAYFNSLIYAFFRKELN